MAMRCRPAHPPPLLLVSAFQILPTTPCCGGWYSWCHVGSAAPPNLLSRLQGHRDIILDLAVSRDGSRIATGSFDNTIRLWTQKTDGTYESSALAGHSASVRGVEFLQDGKTLVSGAGDGTVKLWDIESMPYRERMTLSVGDIVNSVCILDEHEIIIGKSKNRIEILKRPTESRIVESLDRVANFMSSQTHQTADNR